MPSEIVPHPNTSSAATPSNAQAHREAGFGEASRKNSAVSVVLENRLATVAAIHQVI
jgi:hypothetical protein